MPILSLTVTDAKHAALAYAAGLAQRTPASMALLLLEQSLVTYEQGLAQAQAADALKLKAAFDAAKATDTKADIAAKVSVVAIDPVAEVIK